MSSIQANTSPTIPPPTTPSDSPTSHGSEKDESPVSNPAEDLLLNAIKDVRQIIRLAQCGVCSRILREPTTLPCGQSLCKQCIPETRLRTNISWPATPNRLHGFTCPFQDCQKEHALGDCSVDVTLNKTMDIIRAAIEQDRHVTGLSNVSTSVTVQDRWGVAGLSTLGEKKDLSLVLKGGRIVSTYTMAEMGKLEYECEVMYASVGATEEEVAQMDISVLTRLKESARTEMDCQVCYALYLDPLTTACGHTFCRNCLHRVLDHSEYCPICRRTLNMQPQLNLSSFPSNHRLCKIIKGFWADVVASRAQALRAEQESQQRGSEIPIFVCTLSFPSMPTFLHIFEPRYRLMIRRALEGDRTFGMVRYQQPAESGGTNFSPIGTLLRIVSIEFFPDGRSLLETQGVSRFRINQHSWLDGYVLGKIEKIDDISLLEEEELESLETRRGQGVQDFAQFHPQQQERILALSASGVLTVDDLDTMSTRELVQVGVDFVTRMRAQSVAWLTARVLQIFGECPTDPAIFPWWFASVLPVHDDEKYRLLGISSVRQRLKICCRWIVEWESSRWTISDCLVL